MDNYYVYKHINNDGEIVYVGKGRYDRAWCVYRNNIEHVNWLKSQLPMLNIQFHCTNLTEIEAYKIEKELIEILQPKYNKFHTDFDNVRLKAQGKWLATEKSRFNDSELQIELGKRAAKSLNHPNNRLEQCIHCNVQMNVGHIRRYHNDNCKRRVENNELN